MVKKPQIWLAVLLGLQLLLTGALYVHDRQLAERANGQASLLTFDKSAVDKLVLTDKDKGKLTLSKTAEGWQLPDYHSLPADGQKVGDLLLTLSELKGGWPVVTNASSHGQFEVGEKTYARKLDLFSANKPIAQLYLGSSPGLRKTHVRKEGSADVFAATLNSGDIPSNSDGWLDPTLLKAKDPTEIRGPSFTLKKSGAEWQLDAKVGGGAPLNQTHAAALLSELTELRVLSLQTSSPTGAPSLNLRVLDGGQSFTYEFWAADEGASVRRSDSTRVFELPKATYDTLASYNLAKLTEKAKDEEGQGKAPAR